MRFHDDRQFPAGYWRNTARLTFRAVIITAARPIAVPNCIAIGANIQIIVPCHERLPGALSGGNPSPHLKHDRPCAHSQLSLAEPTLHIIAKAAPVVLHEEPSFHPARGHLQARRMRGRCQTSERAGPACEVWPNSFARSTLWEHLNPSLPPTPNPLKSLTPQPPPSVDRRAPLRPPPPPRYSFSPCARP